MLSLMWLAPVLSEPLSYGVAFSAVMFRGPASDVAVKITSARISATRIIRKTGR